MLSFIQGNFDEINPTYVVINSNNIGYVVNISLFTYDKIKDLKQSKIFVHLVVREDSMTLYGFADKQEKKIFSFLISVSGVGANTARLILSSLSPSDVVSAIIDENVDLLKSVKGIGSKTAQRIIIDLKDKLLKEDFAKENLGLLHNTKINEALSGLIMLGFNKKAAAKILNKIFQEKGDSLSVEDLIKEALKVF